jgi:two-component system, OmpR family, sensor histidine kinase KdpD
MILHKTIKQNKKLQYLIGVGFIVLITIVCFSLVHITGYKVVALILLLAVSLLAMLFDILPVLVAAFLSALIWNFFFIPPLYEFSIGTPEDILLFLMYFAIATLNAVLTSKIRKAEMKLRDEEERMTTIKLYNTLLNALSHELRTPISTIIGAIDTLLNHRKNLSEPLRNELLTEINIATLRLNRHVENLLNMSRLDSGSVKPKPDWCDVNELINRCVQNNLPEKGNHQIIFNPNEGLPLYKLDDWLIEQAINNIIHNALQHTPDDSIVEIEANHTEGCCEISISDNGKGFPENQIPFMFEKFYRLPDTSSGGTGLGLSISKGFVEAHKGTIKLFNNKKGGARFIIKIPGEVSFTHHIADE